MPRHLATLRCHSDEAFAGRASPHHASDLRRLENETTPDSDKLTLMSPLLLLASRAGGNEATWDPLTHSLECVSLSVRLNIAINFKDVFNKICEV